MSIQETQTTTETFTTIQRGQHTIIVSSGVMDHISLHNEVGAGSCFKKGFKFSLDTIPETVHPGPNVLNLDETVGYLLVDRLKLAQFLPNAKVDMKGGKKQGVVDGKLADIFVPAVTTDMPMDFFSTNTLTILLFGYNPDFATANLKAYVEANKLQHALVLGSAFPGEFAVRGMDVPAPARTDWAEAGWCVVIPA